MHTTQKNTRKVVTYKDSRQLPFTVWRDLSPPASVVCESLEQYGADFAAIRYQITYELCPEQQPLIEALRLEYEDINRARDSRIRTWFTYGGSEYDEFNIDNVAKRGSIRYLVSHIWVNKLVFYLLLFTTLYPIYLIVWKLFQKPYYLNNHKVLILDRPNLNRLKPTDI